MYQLLNKNVVVATFDLVETTSALGAQVTSVENLQIEDSTLYSAIVGCQPLLNFLSTRKAPKHRAHIEKLFSYLNMDSVINFLDISCGLSLNDTVWVRRSELQVPWESVNMYCNKFSEVVAHYAFSGVGLAGNMLGITSPEYVTDGVLPKCWIRDESDNVLLLKGSTAELGFGNSGFEPCAEYYAAQVAKQMGAFQYVPYDVIKRHGELSSICPLFTSEAVAYTPMAKELVRRNLVEVGYERILMEHELIEAYKDIVFFDCIICNPDRHLGNFGLLKETKSYTTVGLSPIFDNGRGLGALWIKDNYDKDDLFSYVAKEGPKLLTGQSYISAGRLYLDARRRAAAERLKGWTIPKHERYNWPDWKYQAMNELLQFQVRAILK